MVMSVAPIGTPIHHVARKPTLAAPRRRLLRIDSELRKLEKREILARDGVAYMIMKSAKHAT
jgi:hypothetical protein